MNLTTKIKLSTEMLFIFQAFTFHKCLRARNAQETITKNNTLWHIFSGNKLRSAEASAPEVIILQRVIQIYVQ